MIPHHTHLQIYLRLYSQVFIWHVPLWTVCLSVCVLSESRVVWLYFSTVTQVVKPHHLKEGSSDVGAHILLIHIYFLLRKMNEINRS